MDPTISKNHPWTRPLGGLNRQHRPLINFNDFSIFLVLFHCIPHWSFFIVIFLFNFHFLYLLISIISQNKYSNWHFHYIFVVFLLWKLFVIRYGYFWNVSLQLYLWFTYWLSFLNFILFSSFQRFVVSLFLLFSNN